MPAGAATGDGPRLCEACEGIVSRGARRRPQYPARKQARAVRRALSEPQWCPYCRRAHTGKSLVAHMRDAHHASMVIVRDGAIWPPQARNDNVGP
jgi:hypothetical protein